MHSKESYLDLMEAAIGAYSKEELLAKIPENGGLFADTHWVSRAACVIGFLLSKGRMEGYRELWLDMMDALSYDFTQRKDHIPSDFALKEFALCLMETKRLVPPERLSRWIERLTQIDPYTLYHMTIPNVGAEHIRHNINVYNMLGDFLRNRLTGGSCDDYFAEHMPHQLNNFTQEGSYMDPGCPILYDLTTRVHLQTLRVYGYDGVFREDIDARLRKGAQCSLMAQTANGELPFGGRSNQFAFNDVLLAANFEFEAARYKREGDLRLAGQFKRAARLALSSASQWINRESARHVKNYYPRESKHGCEGYAYYAKYLITAGAFAALAYIAADDEIELAAAPCETGSHVYVTDDAFHKVFLAHEGKSAAIELRPDAAYDAAGCGAYQVAGIPPAFILSSPFCAEPGKYVNAVGFPKKPVSITPGFVTSEGRKVYLSELTILSTRVSLIECNRRSVTVEILWEFEPIDGRSSTRETYALTDKGLRIAAVAPEGRNVCFQVPYFVTDGKRRGQLSLEGSTAENRVEDCAVRYTAPSPWQIASAVVGNRNGEYGALETTRPERQSWINIHVGG